MDVRLPQYLFKRGKVYAVRYSVPPEYQSIAGKKEIVRSLGTRDLGEAISLRDQIISEISESLRRGETFGHTQVQPQDTSSTIRMTSRRWLSSSDGIKNSTRVRYQQHLEAFERFAGNIGVSQIDRGLALKFMDHLKSTPSERTGQPLSSRSLQSYQTCLASYWRVLDHWGLVDPDMRNPFSSLLRRVAGQRKKIDPRKKTLRPVARVEAEALLAHIAAHGRLKYQFEMYVTIRLLWVTGCRLNEICGRSVSDIGDFGDHIRITIPESKTEAGCRTVMVVGQDDCALVRAAVKRAQITEPCCPENVGRLFPKIALGGYDGHPSHYLGKALERVRKDLSGDHTDWDMHSFRRSAVSALVNAGVAREARNLAIGHANRDDIGLDVYAKRADLSEIIKTTFEALHREIGGGLRTPLATYD